MKKQPKAEKPKKETKTKSKSTDVPTEITPLLIEGTINYKISFDGESYEIDMGERSMQNDLCCILISKDITSRMKVDWNIHKSNKLPKSDAIKIDAKLNLLSRAISSLNEIGETILLTLLYKCQPKEDKNNG